jgi:very-short-patch-repair endonuclease
MRDAPTRSEALLWQAVRGRRLGVKFRRQHPVGTFIVDLYAPEVGLVVEIDGGVHSTENGAARDRLRDESLVRMGLCVLHVEAERVERELHAVLAELRAVIASLDQP